MQILSRNFLIFTICGLWRPVEWSSNGAKLLYNVFTFIIIFSEIFLMLTQCMDILLIVDNIDDFANNTLLFLSIVAVACKAIVIAFRRNTINILTEILTKTPCKPRDDDETMIQMKFEIFVRSCLMKYLLLCIGSYSGITIASVINIMHGHLPYRIWLPFDYLNIPTVFWTLSIHQLLTMLFATLINVSTDTFVFGMFLQTCAQLEIFENRLHNLIISKTVGYLGHTLSSSTEHKMEISECIHHHLIIFKYAKITNFLFNEVLFVQFFGSMLVLCTSVFYLTTHIDVLYESVTLVMYTIAMFLQIYIYCWSGNEVMVKSASVGDSIYCMDWPLLSINEKKALLMIMMRSTIPIKFTSSFLITVSLQSYSNILKTSYTAFNVLQK